MTPSEPYWWKCIRYRSYDKGPDRYAIIFPDHLIQNRSDLNPALWGVWGSSVEEVITKYEKLMNFRTIAHDGLITWNGLPPTWEPQIEILFEVEYL